MKPAIPSVDKKIPCNSTRFFFDKINGKQFHPKFSGCDEFTVRIQIRKNKDFPWDAVIHQLFITDWLRILYQKGMSCGNATQLVASFRNKKFGDHTECVKSSSAYKKAVAEKKRTGKKDVPYAWPTKCKLRGKPDVSKT